MRAGTRGYILKGDDKTEVFKTIRAIVFSFLREDTPPEQQSAGEAVTIDLTHLTDTQ
jgi:hypothetical protein